MNQIIHTYIHRCIHTYIQTHTYLDIDIYTYIHRHTYIHTQTDIHTYIHNPILPESLPFAFFRVCWKKETEEKKEFNLSSKLYSCMFVINTSSSFKNLQCGTFMCSNNHQFPTIIGILRSYSTHTIHFTRTKFGI